MKIPFLFLSLLIPLLSRAQTNDQSYSLTAQDRKNYILSIDQKNIIKPVDRLWKKQKRSFTIIPLILKNNSNDTLSFWTMTCSWEDIYEINNKNAIIERNICESNFPTVISLAPHKTRILNMPSLFLKNAPDHNYRFRIGMHLLMYSEYNQTEIIDMIVTNKLPKNNLIWSNEVEVPIGN